jgi:hypothetical protein
MRCCVILTTEVSLAPISARRLHLDKDVTSGHVVVRFNCIFSIFLELLRNLTILQEAHRLMKALIIPVQQEPVVLDFADQGGAGGLLRRVIRDTPW